MFPSIWWAEPMRPLMSSSLSPPSTQPPKCPSHMTSGLYTPVQSLNMVIIAGRTLPIWWGSRRRLSEKLVRHGSLLETIWFVMSVWVFLDSGVSFENLQMTLHWPRCYGRMVIAWDCIHYWVLFSVLFLILSGSKLGYFFDLLWVWDVEVSNLSSIIVCGVLVSHALLGLTRFSLRVTVVISGVVWCDPCVVDILPLVSANVRGWVWLHPSLVKVWWCISPGMTRGRLITVAFLVWHMGGGCGSFLLQIVRWFIVGVVWLVAGATNSFLSVDMLMLLCGWEVRRYEGGVGMGCAVVLIGFDFNNESMSDWAASMEDCQGRTVSNLMWWTRSIMVWLYLSLLLFLQMWRFHRFGR